MSKALDTARRKNTLVVWKLDRIGRSLSHVVGLVGDLQKRGVGLKVLTDDIDTTTVTGWLVFSIFATLAEFERDLMLSLETPCRRFTPMSMLKCSRAPVQLSC